MIAIQIILPLADGHLLDIVVLCAAMLVIVGVGAAGVIWLKKYLWGEEADDHPISPTGFTLSDLRQLNRNGQMTDEEFEKAKRKVVEAAQKASAKLPPVLPPGRGVNRGPSPNSGQPPSGN